MQGTISRSYSISPLELGVTLTEEESCEPIHLSGRIPKVAIEMDDALYSSAVREPLEEKVRRLESELNTDAEFRKEQGMKVLKNATKLVNIRPESWEIIRPAPEFHILW